MLRDRERLTPTIYVGRPRNASFGFLLSPGSPPQGNYRGSRPAADAREYPPGAGFHEEPGAIKGPPHPPDAGGIPDRVSLRLPGRGRDRPNPRPIEPLGGRRVFEH